MSRTIKVLSGGGFVTQETRSETMCELREEMGISSNASAAVGGVNVNNSYQLQEGDIVAFVNNDKTGGTELTVDVSLDKEELSVLYTVLNNYVKENIGSTHTGVEFEDALCTKLENILSVYRLQESIV